MKSIQILTVFIKYNKKCWKRKNYKNIISIFVLYSFLHYITICNGIYAEILLQKIYKNVNNNKKPTDNENS